MKINVQINHAHITDKLKGYAQTQVRFLVSKTLNGVAFDLKRHVQAQMPVRFDRPTTYAINRVTVEKSTKANLSAEVYFKESEEQRGKGKGEFIRPGAEGASSRAQKRSEYLLTRNGILPAGWVTLPGRYLASRLDGNGNVPGSYYKQFINLLQLKLIETDRAKKQSMASQKRASKMGVANEFFAVKPGGNTLGAGGKFLYPGIYKRSGRGGDKLLHYFKFVKKASYKVRLDLQKETQSMIAASAQKNWNDAVEYIKRDLAS